MDRLEDGKRDFTQPDAFAGPMQTWEDFSLSALFFDSVRDTTTKKLQEGDRLDGVITLSDNNWHHLDWDPEVGSIELTPDDITGTDGCELATEKDVADNAGHELKEGTTKELIVVGSPVGRVYIRRCDAGNAGNGANTVKVSFVCHGSRKMLGATRRVANTAHD